MKRMYLVGRIVDDSDPKNIHWRIVGLFSSDVLADEHCTTPDHFVRPMTVDEPIKEGERPTAVYFPREDY